MSEQYGDFELIFDKGAYETLLDVVSRLECLIDVVKTVVEEPSSIVALLKAERDILTNRLNIINKDMLAYKAIPDSQKPKELRLFHYTPRGKNA